MIVAATDWGPVIQALLFGFFSTLTAILAAITGPTYDHILVPELAPSSLFPAISPGPDGGTGFLSIAVGFSDYLIVNLVDPAVAVVALGVGLAYLGRSFLGPHGERLVGALPRLIVAVVVANFTLPISTAILDLAGATFPVIAGFDGGAWQSWVNLAGWGMFQLSWDNGAVAFVIAFVLFGLVFALAVAVAIRNALLGVLLVLLPVLTILWPIPTLAPLARRAWLLFAELAFLPCVLVIPLELAVASPNVFLLLGYFTVAVGTPSLISLAGAQLTSVGFPSAGAFLTGGIQRGMLVGSQSASRFVYGARGAFGAGSVGRAVSGIARTVGGAALPVAVPVVTAEFLGRGAGHLFRHVGQAVGPSSGRFDSFRGTTGAGTSRGRG